MEREEGVLGIACVATVVSYRIPATDAMSCTPPVEIADHPDQLKQVTDALIDHARRLERTLRSEGSGDRTSTGSPSWPRPLSP